MKANSASGECNIVSDGGDEIIEKLLDPEFILLLILFVVIFVGKEEILLKTLRSINKAREYRKKLQKELQGQKVD